MLSSDETPADALVAALVELEHHVGELGWDQPPRLFALVPTAELVAAEPELAAHLDAAPRDGYTSVEQDTFEAGDDLLGALARIAWPDAVTGCALTCVRTFLPQHLADEVPQDDAEAAAFVADHPDRHEVRVAVGVLRDRPGQPALGHGVARLRSNPEDLLGSADLVPGLTEVLAATFQPNPGRNRDRSRPSRGENHP